MSNHRMSLDDTLYAVVQLTHEHGLPLTGVSAHAGDALVFTAAADMPYWARWLTDPATRNARCVVWDAGDVVALSVSGERDGITWAVIERMPVAAGMALFAEHGITVTSEQQHVPAAACVAAMDAHAELARGEMAGREGVGSR